MLSAGSIWIFKQAKWQALRMELNAIAWQDVFGEDFSENASKLIDIVLVSFKHHIHFRKHFFRKSLHPWLTDTAFEAIQAKVAAYGIGSYNDAANACSQVSANENENVYAQHLQVCAEDQKDGGSLTGNYSTDRVALHQSHLSRRMSNGCTHRKTNPIH